MKKFISGTILGIALATTITAIAATSLQATLATYPILINGTAFESENPPVVIDGRTYLPLRAIGEALGVGVEWNAELSQVEIEKAVAAPAPAAPAATEAPAEKDEQPVTIDQVSFDINVLPPNSLDTIYIETAFTNNTDYTLSGVQLTYLDKISNEKRYLTTYDTLLPGDTSANVETFGPESGNMDDFQLLETRITVLKEDGGSVFVTYDHKTERYSVLGSF
jgi:hypothetical protein